MDDIEKTVLILAPVEKVWAALTDVDTIKAWMGEDGVQALDLQNGGAFRIFGGETSGSFVAINAPQSLDYTWRQDSWSPETPDSLVHWDLLPTGETTLLHLVHSRLPSDEEREGHDEGWIIYWLEPMKAWLEA